jgi:hypothetical protein
MAPIAYLTLMVPTNLVFTTIYSMWLKRHAATTDAEAAA